MAPHLRDPTPGFDSVRAFLRTNGRNVLTPIGQRLLKPAPSAHRIGRQKPIGLRTPDGLNEQWGAAQIRDRSEFQEQWTASYAGIYPCKVVILSSHSGVSKWGQREYPLCLRMMMWKAESMKTQVTFSFVIPFMNEEEVLVRLLARMTELMGTLDAPCEVVFVDDGSRDAGPAIIAAAARNDPRIKLIRLSRNFGHQIAVTAGLNAVRGRATIIMDADLQDPPEVVPDLVAQWAEGYEIVHAQRRAREGETRFKKMSANLYYRLLSRLSSVEIPRDVGDFRLVDAKVVEAIRSMPERDRYLRGMFAWVGFRQTIVQFDRPQRLAGETKYPLKKMMRLAMDGVIGFSDVPLRLALWLGMLVSFGAMTYGIYISAVALFTGGLVPGWASTIVVLSFLSGMNLLISGVIGLYIGRIHNESKERPLYFISESIGITEAARTPQPALVSHG